MFYFKRDNYKMSTLVFQKRFSSLNNNDELQLLDKSDIQYLTFKNLTITEYFMDEIPIIIHTSFAKYFSIDDLQILVKWNQKIHQEPIKMITMLSKCEIVQKNTFKLSHSAFFVFVYEKENNHIVCYAGTLYLTCIGNGILNLKPFDTDMIIQLGQLNNIYLPSNIFYTGNLFYFIHILKHLNSQENYLQWVDSTILNDFFDIFHAKNLNE